MKPTWRLAADTGGTFTDVWALDPEGRVHRAKVLSSSALRGRVDRWIDERTLELAGLALPDTSGRRPLLAGCTLEILGGRAAGVVEGFDPATGRLRLREIPLDRDLDRSVGAVVEIRSPEPAPILAARLLTGTPQEESLPSLELRLATTRGTNALLERRGARTAFLVTRGFRDLLAIGTQERPDLFARRVVLPAPLPEVTIEVSERLAADGSVVEPVDLDALEAEVEGLISRGIESVAVALLHAYREPAHERQVVELLRRHGFRHVVASAELAPRIKLLPRAETAVVEAYLAPVVGAFLDTVAGALAPPSRLLALTSAGGLTDAADFRAKDSLLSGPAGGVVGAVRAARRSGFDSLIGFDMGGTSTDVARAGSAGGGLEYVFEQRVGGARLLGSALAIETVAAGGGSIVAVKNGRLQVGPESAGASPGPACYGAGGPLTLTDVNLLLGRFDAELFGLPIDRAAAELAASRLVESLGAATGEAELDRDAVLEGCLALADETMAEAIRRISVRRGYDPADHVLVAFGGAGGLHACAVAERLGMSAVLVPAEAGLLSAVGLASARIERFAERTLLRPLAEIAAELPDLFAELEARATAAVAASAQGAEVAVDRRLAFLRLAGQDATVAVEVSAGADLAAGFGRAYRDLYGYAPVENRLVEVESIRVVAGTVGEEINPAPLALPRPAPAGRPCTAVFGGRPWPIVLHDRSTLSPGMVFDGPALIVDRHSTALVPPGWHSRVDGAQALVIEKLVIERREAVSTTPRAIVEELFTGRFEALVREMGELLERTALSTNVKERRDFSCGLLGPGGELVVNAPHIPVHLGGLGPCVRSVLADLPLEPGDVAVTNSPAHGGSHLPDVTVITPVYLAGERLGFVASRAHHAEIGGSRPGSMPPDARRLEEEGVLLLPQLLVEAAEPRFDDVRRRLESARFPSRAVAENLADLAAAVAANARGARRLEELAAAHGAGLVRGQMARLAARAEERVAAAFRRLGDGVFEAEQRLDDGSPIRVRITVVDGRAVISFVGSAPVHPGNLNATPAIVRSAVLYVLRLLVDEPELPLNEGLLGAVTLEIPPGMLAPDFAADPARSPAVVGGNTETSQRVVDTLLAALGLAAGSQGTMNNLIFGDRGFGYYETICGGCGATAEGPGASAVHSHMTNTRITDPEILERRYPVRLHRFEIRKGSGGPGRHPGGDGVRRELEFLAPVSLSLVTQRRAEGPAGLAGGGRGAPGRQWLERCDGRREILGSIAGAEIEAGDRLIVETPGGGGWGDLEGERE